MRINERQRILAVILLIVVGFGTGIAIQLQFELNPLPVATSRSVATPGEINKAAQPESPTTRPELASAATAQREMQVAALLTEAEQSERANRLTKNAAAAIDEARYSAALAILDELTERSEFATGAPIHFQRAVCHESLGQQAAARVEYQHVLAGTEQQPLQTAARLGECRLRARAGEETPALHQLLRMVLSHRSIQSPAVEARFWHELGLTAARAAIPISTKSRLLADDSISLPHEDPAAETLIEEVNRVTPLVGDHPQPACQVITLDETASAILITARASTRSADQFLQEIEAATELTLTMDSACQARLQSLTLQIDCQELPLAIVLDAILTPLHCRWSETTEPFEISLVSHESASISSKQPRRLLSFALSKAPDHSLAAHSQIALAALDQAAGEYDAALADYRRTLERYPHIPFHSVVWLNIGKCLLAQRDDAALAAFQTAADLGENSLLTTIAETYVGRIHLSNGCPREAISALLNAASFGASETLQREIQLMTTAAHLLADQRGDAEAALVRLITEFDVTEINSEVALLAGLLQTSGNANRSLPERDAVQLLEAVANVTPENNFGEYWHVLTTLAYLELGLEEEAVRSVNLALPQLRPFPIADWIEQRLSHSQSVGCVKPLRNKPHWTRSDDDSSLAISREIIADPTSSHAERRLALQQLGMHFQKQGDHDLAIQCLTGEFPADTDQRLDTLLDKLLKEE